jgi:hypothetical protein
VKPISKRDPLVELNSRLEGILNFASGDYHTKYIPDSVYNRGPGVEIKKAVTIKKKPIQMRDAKGEPLQIDLKDENGQVVKRVPKYDTAKTATREYARAKYKTDPIGIKKANEGAIGKLQTDMAAQGRSAEEIKGAVRKTRTEQFKHYVKEVRGSLRGGQQLEGEIQSHRDYMARELKEVRQIVQAKRKFAGTLPEPLNSNQLGVFRTEQSGKRTLIPGNIQERGRAGNFAGFKVKDSDPKGVFTGSKKTKPVISPEESVFYRQRLNEEAGKIQAQAGAKLDRLQKAVTERASLGISRQREIEGGMKLSKDELKRSAVERVKPIFEANATGGPHVSQDTSKTIQETLTHGYRSPENVMRLKPQPINQAHLEKIKARVDFLKNQAAGGFEGVTKAKQQVLNSGALFKEAAPSVAKIEAKGYPHLAKLGKGIAGVGLLAGGIYAGKKYLDKKKKETVEFGLKLTPKAQQLALRRPVKILSDLGYIEHNALNGPSYKMMYEDAIKANESLSGENRKLAEESLRKVAKTTYASAAKARNKGYESAKGELKDKFLKEQKASRDLHDREIKKVIGERDGAIRKATNRGHLAVGAGGVGVATGVYISPRKKDSKEDQLQFASSDRDRNIAGAARLGVSAGATAAGASLLLGLAKRRPGSAFSGKNLSRTFKSAAKWGAGFTAAGAGSSLLGSAILGPPRYNEHGSFLKRGAVGGGIGGAAIGAGIGIASIRNKSARKFVAENAAKWRPVAAIQGAGVVKRGLIGAGIGAVVGGVHLADEGQQVDTLDTLKKARHLSAQAKPIQFSTPVARDRYGKEIVNKETERKGVNYVRSGIIGAGLGSQLRKNLKMPIGRAALVGAGAGLGAEAVVRQITKNQRDQFGEKTKTAKTIESVPWKAGLAASLGIAGARIYKKSPAAQAIVKKYFSSKTPIIRFDDASDRKWAERAIYGSNRASKYNVADRLYSNIGKTHRLIRSTKAAVTGVPDLDERGRERKSEFQKPWVKRAVVTGVIGVGVVGGYRALKKVVRDAPIGSGVGQLRESFLRGEMTGKARQGFPKIAKATDFVTGIKKDVTNLLNKPAEKLSQAIGHKPDDISQATLKRNREAARGIKIESKEETDAKKQLRAIAEGKEKKFSAKLQPIRFAVAVDDWRIDDSRGNSARIFAPGHQKRIRREKEWYERQGTQRAALAGLAIAAPIAGVILHKRGAFKGFRRGIQAGSRTAQRDVSRAAGEFIEADQTNPLFGVVRKKPDIDLSSRSRRIEFGTRVLKSGIIAKWGKALGELPEGTKDTTKGVIKLLDPSTKATAVYQRARDKFGEETNKWWSQKSAYIGNINIPKKYRQTLQGGKSLQKVTGTMLGHFDKAGIRATTIAGAYEAGDDIAKRQAGTLALVQGYQKRGFNIDTHGRNTPLSNEWNVPMTRNPKPAKVAPIDAAGFNRYHEKARLREYKSSQRIAQGHLKEIAKPIGVAGATGVATAGVVAESKRDTDHQGTSRALATAGLVATGGVAAIKGRQVVDYLKENGTSLRDHLLAIGNHGRIRIGKRIGAGAGRVRNAIGKQILTGIV